MSLLRRALCLPLCLLLAAALTACGYVDMETLIRQTEPEANFAKVFLGKLRDGDYGFVRQNTSPELMPQLNDAALANIASYQPKGKEISIETIGVALADASGEWQTNLTFEYHYEGGWAIEQVALKHASDKLTVAGFHVLRTIASQKELNQFGLTGKPPLHYLILGAGIAVLMFSLVTLVVCIRTPMKKWKWLWCLVTLCGVSAINLNWANGLMAFTPITVGFPVLSAKTIGLYAPWIISVYFPVGAIVFWAKRASLLQEAKAAKAADGSAPP